ncbi:MAG TPA: CNNM domain-containing protein [Patescibacteria group bacterium]|nr:CNNM domain-containing protein [Patescibacteria group bacterium]
MDNNHWLELAGFVAMLMASGFFAGAETALTGASRARMVALEGDGNKMAKLVLELREKKEQLISALLLGNSFMNIFASSLATSVLVQMLGENKGIVVSTVCVTVVVFIFAEVMPKTYALMYADRMALALAVPVKIVIAVFSPVTVTVGKVVGWIFRSFGVDTHGHAEMAHEEELRGAIELFKETEENVPADQGKSAMMRSIMELAELTVEEIMIHRRSVNMINLDMPVAQIVDEVLHSAYTRIPAWRDAPDNIVGVVHTKLLLQELRHSNGDVSTVNIENAMMEPWFIPESTTVFDQLQAFRRRREHFAILVDEYGVVTGMITMEDILEEIVGQIDDEHDVAVSGVRPQPDGAYIIDGKVTIRDLNRDLNWSLPDEDYSTVAGLVLFESQRIPAIGQVFHFFECRFEVLKKQRNQITLLRVTPLTQTAPGLTQHKEAYA